MAIDAFMELLKGDKPIVQGETLDKKFAARKAFELSNFKFTSQIDLTEERDSGTTDENREEPVFVLNVTKDIDNATPDLFLNYCRYASSRGGTFDKAILTVRKAGGTKLEGNKGVASPIEYLVFEFRDVYIKTWKLDDGGEDLPEEIFDLCFHYCHIQYTPQTGGGTAGKMVEGFWDFWDLTKNQTGS